MPDGKSICASDRLSVVRCLAGLNLQPVTGSRPRVYEVDKDFGKFYYLINLTSTQHLRQNRYLYYKGMDSYFKKDF